MEMTFHTWRGSIMTAIFRGRRNIWWGWMVTPVAPRIVSNVSCATRINHDSHFPWQAQYLVRLDGQTCCSVQCKWRFKSCLPHIGTVTFRGRRVSHDMQHDMQHTCNTTWGFFVFAYFLKEQQKCFKGRPVGEMAKKEKSLSFFNLSCVLRVVLHDVLHVCCMSCCMANVYLATATPTTTASSHGVQLQTRVRFAICRAPEHMGGISQCMPESANVTSLSRYWRYGCRFLVFTSSTGVKSVTLCHMT